MATNEMLGSPEHRDPCTARAFHKPDGYAGDARLLDMMYDRVPPPGTSEADAALFSAIVASPTSDAVRERAHRAARLIDQVASGTQCRPVRVASLACGHMRELGLSRAFAEGRVEATGLDQDAASLARVRELHPSAKPLPATVRAVLAGRHRGLDGGFDLVYSLGLFDYLDDRAASALLQRMAAWLAPGGKLAIANFAPWARARGYMEAFMDWRLVYRDEADMWAIAPVGRSAVVSSAGDEVVWLTVEGEEA